MRLERLSTSCRSALPFLATLVFFFGSGASGLLYQVVWTRQFVLLFGAAAYAVSTVLSVFFLGLGAGSLWGGRLADRTRRPLYVYGLFELLIGLWALLLLVLLHRGESVVVAVLSAFAASRPASVALRALLALVFLIVPVTLMGATLPLLAKFVTRESRVRALRIGALYSINTLGAVTGCALTGFFLIARLGYTRTTLFGVAVNVAIGAGAMAFGRKCVESDDTDAAVEPLLPRRTPEPSPSASAAILLTAFGVSGFCALALEVLWTRLLVMVFLGTTYAFTTMLTTLLCGIAAGSAAAAVLADRRWNPTLLFGVVEMFLGAACLAMLPKFAELPERFHQLQVELGYDWGRLVRAKFLLSATVLFLPTFLSGMTFPLVVKAFAAGRARLGHDVGALYSANTFGGVLGALAGGFIFIPWLGTHRGIVLLAWTLFAAGALVVVATPLRERVLRLAVPLGGAVLMAWACVRWAPGNVCQALNAGYVPRTDAVKFYREGVEATVLVSEPKDARPGSDRTLWINAVQATASIEKGVKMNRLQGVLPMLFNRDPRRVLFMCLGSGITAGTLSLWDFQRIDAVEISRDVLEAAPQFAADNFDVARNPKVRFIVDDGRNFLLTTANQYDVITFEPMPLALAGVSTFYTREYYELCLRRLTSGGLVSQWVPLHSLSTEVVQSLTYTFTQVFPEYCAWFVNADLFLIGSNQPLRIDYARARERLARPAIAEALADAGLRDVDEVLTAFFMGKAHLDAYVRGGALVVPSESTRRGATCMTDDRPWAEFLAPKLVHENNVPGMLTAISPYFESPTTMLDVSGLDPDEAQTVIAQLDRRSLAKAHDLIALKEYYGGFVSDTPGRLFIESLQIDPNDYNAQYYLKQIALARAERAVTGHEPEKAVEILEEALAYAPAEPELHLLLADVCFGRQELDKAREHYRAYLALGGALPRATSRARL